MIGKALIPFTSTPPIANVDTGDIISVCVVPANQQLDRYLEEIFFDYGWQYSFINGVFTPTQWQNCNIL